MKAVILAAGRGTRLGDLTKETPKCLLTINGKAILSYALNNLHLAGICKEDIAIVVGFEKEQVIRHAGEGYTYIVNSDFASTNDMASFYLSKSFVGDDDCLLMHADVFCDFEIINDCVMSERGKSFLVVDTDNWNEESMKVEVRDEILARVSKDLLDADTHGDWIGIAKIDSSQIHETYREIEKQLALGERKSWIGVKCFGAMASQGQKFYILPTNKRSWIEIDFEHELEKARKSAESVP